MELLHSITTNIWSSLAPTTRVRRGLLISCTCVSKPLFKKHYTIFHSGV